MNILFLTDYWFPQMTPNTICVENIAEELISKGHNIYVCAYSNNNNKLENKNIKFSYINPSLSRKLLKASQSNGKGLSKSCYTIGKLMNRIRRIFLLPVYPIVSFSVPKKWVRKTNSLINASNIDIVISVVAPDESFYAGYLIKRKHTNVKWIVYNIDSGTNVLKGVSFEKIKKLLQRKAIKWENKILNFAEKIIVMEGHSKYYKKVLSNQNKTKLLVSDVPLLNLKFFESNKIVNSSLIEHWVYTGNMNGLFYDPKPMCELFVEYSKYHNADLHLYGPSNHEDYLINITKNSNCIFWHGTLSHDEIIKIQKNAFGFIYYICKNIDSVSGKLFEYLVYGKPIIYLGPKEDINTRQLLKYRNGLSLDIENSLIANVNKIRYFIDKIANNEPVSIDSLKNQYYLCLPETTANMIID